MNLRQFPPIVQFNFGNLDLQTISAICEYVRRLITALLYRYLPPGGDSGQWFLVCVTPPPTHN